MLHHGIIDVQDLKIARSTCVSKGMIHYELGIFFFSKLFYQCLWQIAIYVPSQDDKIIINILCVMNTFSLHIVVSKRELKDVRDVLNFFHRI